MNSDLQKLQPYPFEKLAKLKAGVTPPTELEHIALSIGEPKHPSPAFVIDELSQNLDKLANYPTTAGTIELRQTIADWASRRFKLQPGSLTGADNVLPVLGTREAIFAFTQCAINRVPATEATPLLLSPNPFYQIYEGAAYLSGAEPYYLSCTAENHFVPDFDAVPEAVWQRCQLLFLCSPSNPTGAVTDAATLAKLIALSDQYDFIVASDECYSEIYFDEANPPVGLLEVCAQLGRHDYKNCVVFHSLSKRSNLPGLRSGFVAGDARLIAPFTSYRTYHGSAMSIPVQLASIAAWNDETHVLENRDKYREKFAAVLEILEPVMDVRMPDAGFYLWAATPIPDDQFAQGLFAQQNLTVLPGSYVSREDQTGELPGAGFVRMALVATLEECVEGAQRIRRYVESLTA
ncbi:succinyldiaminopimelate transaminase [Amphritea pacifica]|uniref:Succinyldiaminopimelate transaminase n=1 Tax=Amphritea pacifica TaxID=2811233 RepID=A0ABS2W4E4_9GAMM|nr:succinyldiaminopimelate transaminase [Amphritea pacifica]MBN0986481.1 succinyldiaminopimelate transaminase [Amphritea pacifica]MBN1006195.1 succinyldiaminopimelate transaminase [Amphritea pacifica]